ncbi:hypothetical protein [Sphingobium nicotianae]|uniref:Uncharacterized protein n=1 Tax=Sphingobium nicotianae TaxID=2782607 RepID=A0A9X1AJD4_9SPHN|nr:hypothetical protein [Sphingobium nicotianae]MBT2185548.1 hypothetical protein [Sphingobium nicotianae]
MLPSHIAGLLAYLDRPHERANEDMALAYFRALFPKSFQRQSDAKLADGYVPGRFVLELKGQTSNWLAGLFQALAYRNFDLDFGQVVVAAHGFLSAWQVRDLPGYLLDEVRACEGAPNVVGRELARRYQQKRSDLLALSCWNGSDLFTPLFGAQPELLLHRLASFEALLKEGRPVRQRVTLRNFATVLKNMVPYFDAQRPVAAVRAFYSMIYAWNANSALQISERAHDQATIGGEIVTGLRTASREAFKEFVEGHFVELRAGENLDDFFARYDEALDAVDPEFRRQHGIYFTDLHLSKLAMWIAKQHVPKLGENYLVVDPACGSGNLVTNWRSPLELRHKVVSEIEPELLFAVEQRMKLDHWHNGRFTVVPRVSENRGLNFLDRSAQDYIDELRDALSDKGHAPDKPLAILCNPPYRSDDDQTAGAITYAVHPSLVALTGKDAASERYCCFLAQMKLICEAARSSGLPGDSLLLLFTKSAWLTNRAIFRQIRREIAGVFEDVAGVLVDGSQFFDVQGKWPVAFTIWRYRGQEADLDANRPVNLIDLTWLKRKDLAAIAWNDPALSDAACDNLLSDPRAAKASLGRDLEGIRAWSNQRMLDFKRDRRKSEQSNAIVGGLPLGDPRRSNRKTYGEADGNFIGFMDDLTPCRVKRAEPGKPWFRLNSQFMDIRKNRCFSGPPTHWGYCATDVDSARKLFFWYSLARTFIQHPYPMWADAEDLWEPQIPIQHEARTFALSAAIAYAENECVETWYPANNPIHGTREVYVGNPFTPLVEESFWERTVRPAVVLRSSPGAAKLIEAVDTVFALWSKHLGYRREIALNAEPAYFIDARMLGRGAGLIQIRDYAEAAGHGALKEALAEVRSSLRLAKTEFHDLVAAPSGLDYFGVATKREEPVAMPTASRFEQALARRLALAGNIVKSLHDDRNFGRTKLAKVFYVADRHENLGLETEYLREAAGPLDQRALYNKKFGVEALGQKHQLFRSVNRGRMVRYEPLPKLDKIDAFAREQLGEKLDKIDRIIDLMRPLTTDQAEIVATLYACWNDLIGEGAQPSDCLIIDDFHRNWHPKKARFSDARLGSALDWMRQHDLVPTGSAPKTPPRINRASD